MTQLKHSKRTIVLINVAVLLFLLLLAEWALRISGLGYDNAAFEPDTILHHVHKRNYQFIHHNPAESEYADIAVKYDYEGCVVNPSGGYDQSGKKEIWLIGDSYIEGLQVDFDKSVAGIIASKFPEFRIRNYAVGAYSTILHYVFLKQKLRHSKPQKIFLFLYENDLYEDVNYLSKAKYDNQEVVAIDGGIPPWRYQLIRNSNLIRLIRKVYMQVAWKWEHGALDDGNPITDSETQPDSGITAYYFQKIASLCLSHQVELVVGVIPSKQEVLEPFNKRFSYGFLVRQWCGGQCKYVDLLNPLIRFRELTGKSPYYQHDIHFNQYGHLVTAHTLMASKLFQR